MKFFIIFSLCCAYSLAEYNVKTIDDLLQFRRECVAELNVPASYVEQFKQLQFPNDSVSQCYLKCLFVKFGLFDTENGFQVENIHKQLVGDNDSEPDHNDEVHAKIASCVDKNEQGSNACEWAYRGVTCIIKSNLQLVKRTVQPAAN